MLSISLTRSLPSSHRHRVQSTFNLPPHQDRMHSSSQPTCIGCLRLSVLQCSLCAIRASPAGVAKKARMSYKHVSGSMAESARCEPGTAEAQRPHSSIVCRYEVSREALTAAVLLSCVSVALLKLWGGVRVVVEDLDWCAVDKYGVSR